MKRNERKYKATAKIAFYSAFAAFLIIILSKAFRLWT